MISFRHKGNFKNSEDFFARINEKNYMPLLAQYGERGVSALSSATPKDSGETASSWAYTVSRTRNGMKIQWSNSNLDAGTPVAILIQYGHATRNGGFVEGRDFINPAIQPLFDQMRDEIWKGVTTR